MKKIINSLIVLVFVTLLYCGATILSFDVKSDNDNVVIEWETQNEVNLKEFRIMRKAVNSDFEQIASMPAKGSGKYKYIDKTAYKTTDRHYTYKVILIDNAGNEDGYTEEKGVLHNKVSNIKRTWGSIKALFR